MGARKQRAQGSVRPLPCSWGGFPDPADVRLGDQAVGTHGLTCVRDPVGGHGGEHDVDNVLHHCSRSPVHSVQRPSQLDGEILADSKAFKVCVVFSNTTAARLFKAQNVLVVPVALVVEQPEPSGPGIKGQLKGVINCGMAQTSVLCVFCLSMLGIVNQQVCTFAKTDILLIGSALIMAVTQFVVREKDARPASGAESESHPRVGMAQGN